MRVKKLRGLKRKTNTIIQRLEEETTVFPSEFYNGFWHLHLPADYNFITSQKTPFNVKGQFIQALIDRAEHLISRKPSGPEKFNVFLSLDLPGLWNSQIIIFEGDSHFEGFFERDDYYQKWIPLPGERSIQKERGLTIPKTMNIKGFKELITDDNGFQQEGEIWFIGELG